MKKLLALVIAVIMVVACALSGSAATGISAEEKKIVDALSEKITMASGTVVNLPDRYINQAEDYLMKAELTSDQINQILTYIDNAQNAVAASTAPSLSKAEVAVKQSVINEAKAAANVINATLSVTKNGAAGSQGTVTADYNVALVFDSISTVPGYTAGTRIELSLKNDEIVQAGAEGNMTMVVVGSVLVLVAAAFVAVVSRKKASSK